MFREPYAPGLMHSGAMFIEPPWKAVLSNKAMLPLLWERHPGTRTCSRPIRRRPARRRARLVLRAQAFFSREGWDLDLIDGATRRRVRAAAMRGRPRPAALPPPPASTAITPCSAAGSWAKSAAGLSVREDKSRITRNVSRFLPHVILD
jgi:glutathionylspermidine synthase